MRKKANNRQILLQVLQHIQFSTSQVLAFCKDNANENFDQPLECFEKLDSRITEWSYENRSKFLHNEHQNESIDPSSPTSYRRLIDVETTSCVYWVNKHITAKNIRFQRLSQIYLRKSSNKFANDQLSKCSVSDVAILILSFLFQKPLFVTQFVLLSLSNSLLAFWKGKQRLLKNLI